MKTIQLKITAPIPAIVIFSQAKLANEHFIKSIYFHFKLHNINVVHGRRGSRYSTALMNPQFFV